jgi:hypothetical protein
MMKKIVLLFCLTLTLSYTDSTFAKNIAEVNDFTNLINVDVSFNELEKTNIIYTDCGSVAYGVFAVWYNNGAGYDESLSEARGSYVRCNGNLDGWELVQADIEERWG